MFWSFLEQLRVSFPKLSLMISMWVNKQTNKKRFIRDNEYLILKKGSERRAMKEEKRKRKGVTEGVSDGGYVVGGGLIDGGRKKRM